jgi:hypothetical protein
MQHRFEHVFDEDEDWTDFSFPLDLPQGASVRFNVGEDGIWLSANRAGWLHLARVCAEMGLRDGFEPGYHFHRTMDWNANVDPGHEVAFEFSGEQPHT